MKKITKCQQKVCWLSVDSHFNLIVNMNSNSTSKMKAQVKIIKSNKSDDKYIIVENLSPLIKFLNIIGFLHVEKNTSCVYYFKLVTMSSLKKLVIQIFLLVICIDNTIIL